jgi:hypothetical protein
VSQATLVREAIAEYVLRHDVDTAERSPEEAWARLLDGYYSGSGEPNDHDDIYA